MSVSMARKELITRAFEDWILISAERAFRQWRQLVAETRAEQARALLSRMRDHGAVSRLVLAGFVTAASSEAELRRILLSWARAVASLVLANREEAHAVAKRVLAQAHTKSLQEREQELANWREHAENWARSLRKRHEASIHVLTVESKRESDLTVLSRSIIVWCGVVMRSRLNTTFARTSDLERACEERDEEIRRLEHFAEYGERQVAEIEAQNASLASELTEVRHAASDRQEQLQRSIAELLDQRVRTTEAHGLVLRQIFVRLLQSTSGDAEVAWLAAVGDGGMDREGLRMLSAQMELSFSVADAVWAAAAPLQESDGTLYFDDFARETSGLPPRLNGSAPSVEGSPPWSPHAQSAVPRASGSIYVLPGLSTSTTSSEGASMRRSPLVVEQATPAVVHLPVQAVPRGGGSVASALSSPPAYPASPRLLLGPAACSPTATAVGSPSHEGAALGSAEGGDVAAGSPATALRSSPPLVPRSSPTSTLRGSLTSSGGDIPF